MIAGTSTIRIRVASSNTAAARPKPISCTASTRANAKVPNTRIMMSAALIMILVFGTFAFARVLAVQLIGFGLAAAVLLDATLIRMVLVPAIMHIAGRWNWWPGVRAPKLEPGNSD